MSNIDLSQPTRQSIKGLVILFLLAVKQAVRTFWAIIAVLILQRNLFQDKSLILIGVGVLLLLLIAHTILYYLNFYFYVNENEFILKKGYLRKKVLTIPFERIQSINTKQNLVQQALNVVALEIDTAGTAGKELTIHAIDGSYAEALNKILSQQKVKSETTTEEVIVEKDENEILHLQAADLLKIGISENHLRTALIILAFGSQIFNQVQEVFEEKANEYSGELVQFLSSSGIILLLVLGVLFLAISILISLVKTLIVYYDFRLLKTKNTYRVEAGLLNKRNVVLPHKKIQQLNWQTNPLKKLFGIYKLVFKQAVSMENRRTQVVDAPGCLEEHLEMLKTDLFGSDNLSSNAKIKTDSYYFRPLWFFSGWLPVLLATPFFYAEWIFWTAAGLWLLLTFAYNTLVLRKRYFQINNQQIRISQGAVSHQFKQMELFKIQSVQYKQSIIQKRKELASLKLMNASGSITIPYINEELAQKLYDYFLYHTETSEKQWM